MKKITTILFVVGLICIAIGITFVYGYEKIKIEEIDIKNYNEKDNTMDININISNVLPIDVYCAISKDKDINKLKDKDYIKAKNNLCSFNKTYDDYYIFLKYQDNIKEIGNLNKITKKVVKFDIKENKISLVKGIDTKIPYDLKSFGSKNIKWTVENKDILKIENDTLIGLKKGTTKVKGVILDKEINFSVEVTSLLVDMPKHFDYNKSYLPCNRYTKEEADALDKELFNRIEESGGYKTRAAVVAAARFLTLEFPYKIDYFFENGRANNSGMHLAEGEGRYYKVGLYLHESKFKDIKYTFAGPAIWGCPLTNYENYGSKYISGLPSPNGLDCSGFVAWALLNGGYDVGDRGAGETADSDFQMTDLGERVRVTNEIVYSNKIKVGDLINWWGHIGIIIGIDNDTYYVAETLDAYEGLTIREYKKERMSSVWDYVMLMDSVYEKEGNYTNMWY